MFPFGGLLGGLNDELKVPGQDSPETWAAFAGWPDTAYSGFRFDTDGRLYRRSNAVYSPQTNMWINGDFWDLVDASLYECRYTSVTGNTTFLTTPGGPWSSGNDATWYAMTSDRLWYMSYLGPEFSGFFSREVAGIIQVREIADTGNVRSGNLTLRVTWDGIL